MTLRTLLLILSLIFASPLFALSQSEPVSDQRFRDEFGWAAAVVNKQHGGVCGGVIIAPRWVLTAAHCAGTPRYVLVGSASRSVARRIEVSKRIRHPDFNSDTGQYDLALLYLAEAVDSMPARLASSVESQLLLTKGAPALVVGWGHAGDSPGAVDRLRIAKPTLNNLVRLGSLYRYQGYAGPCGSDSGSPMLMQTLDGRWLVVGLARAAADMCSGRLGTAIYTDVGRAEAFIQAYVGKAAG